ncbi:protein NLRC3-like [Gouania willdenowi]|uniref:protein NLRC3-like n=1 Tax=Gouania willdenowi TaxID=441366 RepID=UPI0010567AF9|nr:protein NLRC3-like [Gouania willdenowi]
MKQEELAERLQSRTKAHQYQRELKSKLKKKFQCVSEGVAKAGSPTLLKEMFTELYITEGGGREVNQEHEVIQIETVSRRSDTAERAITLEELFKAPPGRPRPIRTVMTKGVAGIGKTLLTHKFTVDWAEDKAQQEVHFTFPLTFRELNVLRGRSFSLVGLVDHFFSGSKEAEICSFPDFLSREMMESLGKLAFEQLQKGKLIFYESDLTECGMDLRAASVCSGVFTQVFIEESSLYQDKVFTFIHLSLQEFLAALHVHQTFISSQVNLLEHKPLNLPHSGGQPDFNLLHQSAVDKALRSPNGHLDLFLRFLLGLSLPTNQRLLQGLLTQRGSDSQNNQKTVKYIKKKLSESLSTERSINLFHCLNEVNDHSLLEQIQQSMRSGNLSTEELSPAQWSALVFILLSSQEHLDVFDLKSFSPSEEAFLKN